MIDQSPPEVSICIPTLHGGEHLDRCLRSIREHTPHDYEIVVVESGSRSRGFTVPMNQALRAARGSVLVALNDDVEVTSGWLTPLVDAVQQRPFEREPDVWMAAPDQRSTDGEQVMCAWCVAFPRYALFGDGDVHLGLYDEQFVFWCSDIDLARRAIEAGHPPVRVRIPEPLRHVPGQTPRSDELGRDALADLERYRAKWGSDPLVDKTQLRSVDWPSA